MSSLVKKILSSSWAIPNYDYTNVVKAFFKNSLGGAKYVPKEVIKFYGQCNGFGVYALNDIFSLERLYNEAENFLEFIDAMGLTEENEASVLVPVADDGMGGYYAFKSAVKDPTIYYLDHEFPSPLEECQSFKNFNEFLEHIKDLADSLDEDEDEEEE